MKVVLCGSALAGSWDGYVEKSPAGSFYHRYGWKRVNEKSFGHETLYLAAEEGGEIKGVLPLVCLRSLLFGRLMCSLPFVNYGGICAGGGGVERALLREAKGAADERGVSYIEFRSLKKIAGELPTSLKKVSLTMDLTAGEENIWDGFRTKHRTNIRRAYKNGLTASRGGVEQLDEFYDVFCDSWRAHGTPVYGKSYFRNILEEFPGETAVFTVRSGGETVAAAFNGYHRKTVEGMWAGTHSRFRKLQPTYVLYWEMIKDACEKGFGTYHFGRSSVESGGEQHKKKWNMEQVQLYWQYYLRGSRPMPQLNVDNPRYRMAIGAWRRMPLSVTRLLGPRLARSIP